MDHAAYHVVYVDTRMSPELDGKYIQTHSLGQQEDARTRHEEVREEQDSVHLSSVSREIEEVRNNVQSILSVFNGVHICTSGNTCMTKLGSLEALGHSKHVMIVILGVTSENEPGFIQVSNALPHSSNSSDIHGLSLLQHISTKTSISLFPKLVVPVTMIYNSNADSALDAFASTQTIRASSDLVSNMIAYPSSSLERPLNQGAALDAQQMWNSIDLGAKDVLTSPLQEERLRGLKIHAYSTLKEALGDRTQQMASRKLRKLSWLGNTDNKPYAYLREKMVSELMVRICDPDEMLQINDFGKLPDIDAHREDLLRKAIGSWEYSGHDYSDDELVHAACFMIRHALEAPELKSWRLSAADLETFLMASRAAYNGFVNYHNFRHVVDVMQAIFYFLIQIGTLSAYPNSPPSSVSYRGSSPVAALLRPFDALTLLITAIGHDVGHPGVNNAFLVALNAPLAQLYNDKSVLEAFHCAAYSQILRRFWKAAFEDIPMRGLMINSILATDMGVHGKYMSDLGKLQEKLHHNNGTDGWNPQTLDEYRVLTCALLVKCADISNVARPFDIAEKWASVLQLEFANQGIMERDIGIATTLFGGPPELGNIVKLGNSQNSFINMFARPLFEAVTDLVPAMAFAVDGMKANQEVWSQKLKFQTAKHATQSTGINEIMDGQFSPRSGSPNRSTSQPELSHPEGFPASSPSSQPVGTSPRLRDTDSAEQRRMSTSSLPQHHGTNDTIQDASRRSSLGNPLAQIASNPDSAASFSRRSSGALSAASTPHATFTARRTSNTSPSQLQLDSDSRIHRHSSLPTSENKQPNGRASEDTLSQSPFAKPVAATSSSRRCSVASGGAGDVSRRSSRGDSTEHMRSDLCSSIQTNGRPYAYSGHHRSSSGAHTTNTNISQSTPYSPTDTQATSVLTADSDENRSPEKSESWMGPDCYTLPDIPNLERPGSGRRFESETEQDATAGAQIVKTTVYRNGNVREAFVTRTVGRKGARFNFSFFKRRAKGIE